MDLLQQLRTRIFADGADRTAILEMYSNPLIQGFTTNPTLMRKAGVADYEDFARGLLDEIRDRPISFEVFADDLADMEQQARHISSWGENVYVKVPVMTTRREPTCGVLGRLCEQGVKVNLTALMCPEQVRHAAAVLGGGPPSFVSVFAGRVADTGRDPVPLMEECVSLLRPYPNIQLIWASPRELLNVFQADAIGCHVITVTNDVLKKLHLVGKDLMEYSLETVQMFFDDGAAAGYTLAAEQPVAGALS